MSICKFNFLKINTKIYITGCGKHVNRSDTNTLFKK